VPAGSLGRDQQQHQLEPGEGDAVTGPAQPRPVPGPPGPTSPAAATPAVDGARFADLAGRPVTEHVAVYEAEHERLQRELSTIDQL
jgi:hypothetical protein